MWLALAQGKRLPHPYEVSTPFFPAVFQVCYFGFGFLLCGKHSNLRGSKSWINMYH
jgi:hypothetical protein